MTEDTRRPHFFPRIDAQTDPFTSTGGGGGGNASLPSRVRQDHASALLDQYTDLKDELDRVQEDRGAHGLDVDGEVVTFELEQGTELKVTSLEKRRSRIELLSYKEDAAGGAVASVFVPSDKREHYSKVLEDYRDKDTKAGAPKNEKLVAHVNVVRRPTLADLWTDPSGRSLPTDALEHWWELWVRDSVEEDVFREQMACLGIHLSPRRLHFPDRWVFLAHATPQLLESAIELLASIAEVRGAQSLSHYFAELPQREAREFTDELEGRLEPPPSDAPYVCMLDTGGYAAHPLLRGALSPADQDAVEPSWGTHDHDGHGTEMCGFALYAYELEDLLQSSKSHQQTHRLATVKVLPPRGQNDPDLYGDITSIAVSLAELQRGTHRQVFTSAVTDKSILNGIPTSWSAAVDQICSGSEEDEPRPKRCMIISAGNADFQSGGYVYPDSNHTDTIQDPAHAWNAVTVGAYTERTLIDPAEGLPGWEAIAPVGDLSPTSTTSLLWDNPWPNKPDVVFEGGNLATDPTTSQPDVVDSLSLLTTGLAEQLLMPSGMTSAAANIAGNYAARIWAPYPDIWPETVRGLLIHSARWTEAMESQFGDFSRRERVRQLLRCYGYGVPRLEAAVGAVSNSATLIIEDELQPYMQKPGKSHNVTKEMKSYELPWPEQALVQLGEIDVRLRVTLSYFIEPNPSERGRTNRYRYASHGLRFAFKTATETEEQFKRRINKAQREEGASSSSRSDSQNWDHGQECLRGSVHSDVWRGSALDLSSKGLIAVYPTGGWWKDYTGQKRHERKARFSLIVSIETDDDSVDLYNEVANLVETEALVDVSV